MDWPYTLLPSACCSGWLRQRRNVTATWRDQHLKVLQNYQQRRQLCGRPCLTGARRQLRPKRLRPRWARQRRRFLLPRGILARCEIHSHVLGSQRFLEAGSTSRMHGRQVRISRVRVVQTTGITSGESCNLARRSVVRWQGLRDSVADSRVPVTERVTPLDSWEQNVGVECTCCGSPPPCQRSEPETCPHISAPAVREGALQTPRATALVKGARL